MPTAAAGLPLKVEKRSDALAPSSTRATSLSRIDEPSGLARTMMRRNSSSLVSRPLVLIVSWNCWSWETGAAPMRPTAACVFCDLIASTISAGAILRLAIFCGSSQTRIE